MSATERKSTNKQRLSIHLISSSWSWPVVGSVGAGSIVGSGVGSVLLLKMELGLFLEMGLSLLLDLLELGLELLLEMEFDLWLVKSRVCCWK